MSRHVIVTQSELMVELLAHMSSNKSMMVQATELCLTHCYSRLHQLY